jgi:hypothetical protein
MCSRQPTVELAVGQMKKHLKIVLRQPSPQLIDDCTFGTIPFPLYREFPGYMVFFKTYQHLAKS